MGADILLVVESSETGQFLHPRAIAFFEWPRYSLLFNAMTNRRGRDGLIAARGFPEPASSMSTGSSTEAILSPRPGIRVAAG